MRSPYRTASRPNAVLRLNVSPETARSDQRTMMAALLVCPTCIAVIFYSVGQSTLVLPGIAAMIVGLLVWGRWARKIPLAVFTLSDGVLSIAIAGKRARQTVLSDISEVRMDIKTIERVVPDVDGAPGAMFIHANVAPKVDTARVVIVTAHGIVRLTEDFTSHIDATEALSRIRRFLRAQGWKPDAERDAASSTTTAVR